MASAENESSQEMDVATGRHLIDAFLTDIVQQVKRDVGHMLQLVHQWDLQECATPSDMEDDRRLGPITIQKVDEYLDCFFARRVMFTKDGRELPTSEEDLQLGQSILPTTADLVAALRIIIPTMLNMVQEVPEGGTATQEFAGSLSKETDLLSLAVPVLVRDEVDEDSVAEYITQSQVASKIFPHISPTQIMETEIYAPDLGISSSITDEMLRTVVESQVDTSGPVEREIYLETCKDISPALLGYGEDDDVGIQTPVSLKPTSPDVSTPTIIQIRDLSSLTDIRKAGITTEEAVTDQYPFEDTIKTPLTESSSAKDAIKASQPSFHPIEPQIDDKTTYVFQVPVVMEVPDTTARTRSPAEDLGSISSIMSEMSWGKDSDSSLSITSQESGKTTFLTLPTTVEIPDDSRCESPIILDAMSLFSASPDNRVILESTDGVEALKTASGTVLLLSKEATDEKVAVLSSIPSTEQQYLIESPSPSSIPSSSVLINVPVSGISQAMAKDVPSTTAESVNILTPGISLAINEALTDVNQMFKGSPITLVMPEDGKDDKILEARPFSPTESDFRPSSPTTIIQTIQNIPLCLTTALQSGLLTVPDGALAAEVTQGPSDDTETRQLLFTGPRDVLDKEVPGTEVLTSFPFTPIDSGTPLPPLAIMIPSVIADSISPSIAPTFSISDLSVAAERRVDMPESSEQPQTFLAMSKSVQDEVPQTRPLTSAMLPDTAQSSTGEVLYVSAENLMNLLAGPQPPGESVPFPFLLQQSGPPEALQETAPPPVPTAAPVYISLPPPSSMADGTPPPCIVYDKVASILEAIDILPTTLKDPSSVTPAPAEGHPTTPFPIITLKQQDGLDASADAPIASAITTDAILSSLSLYMLDSSKKDSLSEATSAAATDDTLPSTSTKVEHLVESLLPMVSKDTCPTPLVVLKECLDAVSSSQSAGLQDTGIVSTIASLAQTDTVTPDSNLAVITTAMLGKVLEAVAESRLQTESPDDVQSKLYDAIEKDQSSTLVSVQDRRILAQAPTSSSTPQHDDTQLGITQAMLDSLLVADTRESAQTPILTVAERPALTPLMALALQAQAVASVDPSSTDDAASKEYLGNILSAVSTSPDFIRELSAPMTSQMLGGIISAAQEIKVDTLFPHVDVETSGYPQITFPVASTYYGDEGKVPLSRDLSVLQDGRTIPFTALSPSAQAIIVDQLPAFIPGTSEEKPKTPSEQLRVIHPGFANLTFDRHKLGMSTYASESVRKDRRKSPTEKSKKGVFGVFSTGLKSVKEKLCKSTSTLDKVAETGLPSTICKTPICGPSSCFQVCKEKCCMSSSGSEYSKDEDSETKLSSSNSTRSETGRKICSEICYLPSTETANGDNIISFAQALLDGFIKADLEEKKSTPQMGEVCHDVPQRSSSMGRAMPISVRDINSSGSRSSSVRNYESRCRSFSPIRPSSAISASPDSTLPIITSPALDGVSAGAKIDSTDSTSDVVSCCGTCQKLCIPALPKDLALTESPGTALKDATETAPQDCSAPSTTADSKGPGFTQTLSVKVSLRSLCPRSDKK